MRCLISAVLVLSTLSASVYAEVAKEKKPIEIEMLVTAYCPCKECCGPAACGITASGRPVTANGGMFCAAPREYRFGTMLAVPGYNDGKPIPVYDRGGAIKGNHIDLFFPTHQQAREWGSQHVVVTVWK